MCVIWYGFGPVGTGTVDCGVVYPFAGFDA